MDSISESYADELFGMLVKEYGLETILNRMKIINGDDYLLGSIASVIQRRASFTVNIRKLYQSNLSTCFTPT